MSAIGDLERLLAGTDDSRLLRLEAKRLRQALADAEGRGAERERAAVVRWLRATHRPAIAELLEAGKHLEDDE